MSISCQEAMGGKCLEVQQPHFYALINTKEIKEKAAAIASGQLDEEARKRVKASLPAMSLYTFKGGVRKNENVILAPRYMVDLDHIEEDIDKLWKRIAPRAAELKIRMAYKTISTHGLRLVADWRQGFTSIEENQRWLVKQLGLEQYMDSCCKDPARLSFLVPQGYFYLIDDTLFEDEEVPEWFLPIRENYGKTAPALGAMGAAVSLGPVNVPEGTQTEYKGIPLKSIASVLLDCQGGRPVPGQRNARYFAAASELRNITDYNPYPIYLALREGCTLPDAELLAVCQSAVKYRSRPIISAQLQQAIELLENTQENAEEEITAAEALNTDIDFTLPPIFKQWHDAAPSDFKAPVVLSLLPILGALGSKLRARYISGKMEEPSFQVVLEAPQASGKGFLEMLAQRCLRGMIAQDMAGLAEQKEFEEKIRLAKLTQGRTKAERAELQEFYDTRPRPILRYMPATVSITKMLMLTEQAQGCHLFQFAPEIDTINKAYKRSFSDLSDLLRCAWDHSLYGQSYASDTSFTGLVRLRLNTLWSGTPRAVQRFFNDSEDGTLSRTLFISLPDQFGKKMQTFTPFTEEEERRLDEQLQRLSQVTLVDGEVQEEHEMNLDWLNRRLDKWLEAQRQLAVKTNDRTRGTFYRRAGVEGFRAGMLAYFLWQERDTPTVRKNVGKFAQWVANMMLQGLIRRVRLEDDTANAFFASVVYNSLPDEFSREQLEKLLKDYNFSTSATTVASAWNTLHLIEKDKAYGATQFKKVPRV